MRRLFSLTVMLTALLAAMPGVPGAGATDAEDILSFHGAVTVHPDASLTVTETIRVRSAGQKIKRGIYRDFPTDYRDRNGRRVVVGFRVTGVTRDGSPEPYHIERLSNGQRVYIGRKNYFLPAGEHTYAITYRTDGQIGFFEDHDELYWNVTGNGWDFPILRASAAVTLPEGARAQVLRYKGYTGRQGSKEEALTASQNADWDVVFETTRPLGPREGLTIAVSWPKGFVRAPVKAARKVPAGTSFAPVSGNGADYSVFYGILAVCLIFIYYLVVWNLVGRDPAKGTIIPLFHPPEKLSPAVMRYILKMGYDNKAFTAEIIHLAVKGHVKIEERTEKILFLADRTYTVRRAHQPGVAPMTTEEKELLRVLLGFDEAVELKNKNHQIISDAMRVFKRLLKRRVESVYFMANRGDMALGTAISAAVIYGVLSLSLVTHYIVGFVMFVLVLLLNLGFYHLLKAPTLKGRRIMDRIEGFRMYLSVAEKDRLNVLNPPEKTPELFEKYLPYALALDVEQKWAAQFNEVFARLAREGADYRPGWYAGGTWDRFNTSHFTSSLADSFSQAVSSSAVAPGSSSGFGGGGFSGGGGGGGGGGGW